MNKENNTCLCIGSCIQFDIWEGVQRKNKWELRLSVSGCKGIPTCQITNKTITKTKFEYDFITDDIISIINN